MPYRPLPFTIGHPDLTRYYQLRSEWVNDPGSRDWIREVIFANPGWGISIARDGLAFDPQVCRSDPDLQGGSK